jgi:hypothetical protein
MVIAILCPLVGGLVAFAVLRFLPAHLRRHLAGNEATVQAAVDRRSHRRRSVDQHAKSETAELDLRTRTPVAS